jgi:hypothetical protein
MRFRLNESRAGHEETGRPQMRLVAGLPRYTLRAGDRELWWSRRTRGAGCGLWRRDAGCGRSRKSRNLGIFFVDAEDFNGAAGGKTSPRVMAPPLRRRRDTPPRSGKAVRAGAVGAEALQQKRFDFGERPCSRRSAASWARVQSSPITSVSSFLGELVAQGQALGLGAALAREVDAAVARDVAAGRRGSCA